MNSQKQARRNQDFEENAEVLFLISDIVSLPNEREEENAKSRSPGRSAPHTPLEILP